MKAEKTLSIKIKSKTERPGMDDPEIEMISEWNLKRIITALIIFFILLIIILMYYFSRLDDNDVVNSITISSEEKKSIVKLPGSIKESTPERSILQNSSQDIQNTPGTKEIPDTLVEDTIVLLPVTHSTESTNTEISTEKVVEEQVAQEKPEILNQHITEARLARWVKDKVPHGKVSLPLRVGDSKAEGFYYFTDINNMQGDIVFHEWLREGKSIYKRKFIIKGDRARMSTSKLFTYRTTGQWQVRLITDQGKVMHEINFLVINK